MENTSAGAAPAIIRVGGQAMAREQAWAAVRRSAHWFWWIAGLSVINSLAAIVHAKYSMALGLGTTQIIDALFTYNADGGEQSLSGAMQAVHLGIVLVPIALFYFFGRWAANGSRAAWISGMVVYLLDGAVFLLASDWIGIAVHAFVLYVLFGGLRLLKAVRAAEAQAQASSAAPPVADAGMEAPAA